VIEEFLRVTKGRLFKEAQTAKDGGEAEMMEGKRL
jgi:hypothetical protein